MGWMIMYCVMFMVALGSAVNYATERRDQADMDLAGALSEQMAVWHQAAVQFCQALPTNCPAPARIDPRSTFATAANGKYAYTVLTNAPAYNSGAFTTLVDPTLKLVVTFYHLGSVRLDGQMVAAMTAANGWNVMMGQYNAAKQQLDRADVLEADNPALTLARVPNSIAGVAIPDKAPIIVTQYKN